MFFEGNEISRLQKRKVGNDELVLLSLPENISNFQRTVMLLQKANKMQRIAGLHTPTMVSLC
jgi:hypothetical protein